ncbi:MAG: GlxA family transcriptional regulator [Methylomicrobium sp.]|nr:GlxA family transcriptional regulator [Methylomicrobium sp.]
MPNKFVVSSALLQNPIVRRISIVAYPGAEVLDITGPFEVFAFASLHLQRVGLIKEPVYLIEIVAEKPGAVTTMTGLQIFANRAFDGISDGIDTLVIPGSIDLQSMLKEVALMNWVTFMATRVRRLASVCTGAFLLAECGLLDNLRATTHWNWCEELALNYPAIQVEVDHIFIRNDSIYTSGGITSGIDLALAMVEEDWGRELALCVARYLVMFLKRPGGQSQFSTYLTSEAHHRTDIRDLQAWIIANPAEDHHVDNLARRMAMSPRNFARTFLTETGVTPAKFVEMARIDAARQHLENTALSIEDVAEKAGFFDSERMRRAFVKHMGVNPQDYRKRFSVRPNSATSLAVA